MDHESTMLKHSTFGAISILRGGREEEENAKEVDVCIGDQALSSMELFECLGSMIHKTDKVNVEITHRIKARWLKWMATSWVSCKKNVSLNRRGNFIR